MKINLLKLTFTITILGILLLTLTTNILQPKLTTINQLTSKQLNKQIKIQGTITNIQQKETFQILTIQDSTSKINALLNNPQIKIILNQNITLTGILQQYKKQLQIQTNKIIPN